LYIELVFISKELAQLLLAELSTVLENEDCQTLGVVLDDHAQLQQVRQTQFRLEVEFLNCRRYLKFQDTFFFESEGQGVKRRFGGN
jgi:hypothetical protein